MDVPTQPLIWLVMAIAVVGSLVLSRVLRVPYPSFLVVAGLLLGLLPGTPVPRLHPDLVFLGFLPPLVYIAAFFASPRELFALRRPIGFLAVGLVGITMLAVAAATHALLPGLGWAPALVLGAAVAPTDPVAATAVLQRIGGPTRLVTVLEGESLVNDGVALVAFGIAVEAVSTTVSATHIVLRLAEVVAGGVAIGIAVGWLVARIRERIDDPPIEIAISLVTPYVAYLPAERIHTSGVLAVVACGLYLGWRSPGLFLPRTRLQATAFWQLFAFILNSVLFVLLGLEFERIVGSIADVSPWRLAWYAGAVSAVVVGVRLATVFGVPVLTRFLGRRGQGIARERLVVGWSGMRGAISLATALAIPLTAAGEPFPRRDMLIFLAFCVILATLVIQGTTLAPLVSGLGIGVPPEEERRHVEARVKIAHAALARLDERASEDDLDEDAVTALHDVYERRIGRLAGQLEADDGTVAEEPAATYRALHRELIDAERERLLELRRTGELSENDMRDIQRELDLEQSRLGR